MKFNPAWTWGIPAAAWALVLIWLLTPGFALLPLLLALGLLGSVICAVHHAEVISLKVGEPFGTLVLALAVTTIEVALIVSMMLNGGEEAMALPRDTLFAAIMIIMNGIIGLSLLMGGRKNSEQRFNLEGTTEALSTISFITVLTLVLANFTSGAQGVFSPIQMGVVAAITFVVFVGFIRFQTMLHRDYFLDVRKSTIDEEVIPEDKPTTRDALISLALLVVSLAAVVVSAKGISPTLEAFLGSIGAPATMLGVIIAAIVLLPEFTASIRAAQADRLQTSLNLALGSAIASIGLTVPVVSALSLWMGWPLLWGLGNTEMVLLALTLFLAAISLRTGYTTRQPGVLHLALFATFMVFTLMP